MFKEIHGIIGQLLNFRKSRNITQLTEPHFIIEQSTHFFSQNSVYKASLMQDEDSLYNDCLKMQY